VNGEVEDRLQQYTIVMSRLASSGLRGVEHFKRQFPVTCVSMPARLPDPADWPNIR
jgi:hypothetical protein